MITKLSICVALVALSVQSVAQTELVHYDPVGQVNETSGLAGITAPGVTATALKLVGASPGSDMDSFHMFGWSNSATPDLGQYIEFNVQGPVLAGTIQFAWFPSTFGPNKVAVRSSSNGYAFDLDTANKANVVTLDVSAVGSLSGPRTFRLYFYGGSSGGGGSLNVVFIDGSGAGGIGLKLFSPFVADDCSQAIALPSTFADTPYVANGATTDGMDASGFCDYGTAGDEQNYNDIWFTYTPAVGGCTYISTFNQAGYDTRLTIYQGYSCPDNPANIIACVDDEEQPSNSPYEAGLDVHLTAGQTYTIRLGTYSAGTPAGSGVLKIEAGPGAQFNSGGTNPGAPNCPAANDNCVNAIALPSAFADSAYNATGATTDGVDSTGFCDYGFSGDEQNHNDVWFTYTPDIGGCTYISTFGLAGYDTRLTVYQGSSCPDDPASILACVDDEQQPPTSPFEAGLDVELTAGQTYLIRLGTFSAGTPAGAGILRIAAGPMADVNSGGANPGAPGCNPYPDSCNGDGGDQAGCTDCPCFNNATPGTIGGCLNSAATSARLSATGDASVSLPFGSSTDLRFEISGAPPTAFCILNSGDAVAPGNMANPCFGLDSGSLATAFDGLRCAIMNTRRHGGRSADASGDVGVTNNPWGGEGGPPPGIAVAGGGFASGQTRYFQVINRDDVMLSCMRGLNTSQSVRVTFTP